MSSPAGDIRSARLPPPPGRVAVGPPAGGPAAERLAMNMTQTRSTAAQLRASDADRDAVVATLSEHYQAGRLSTDELKERTGSALTARTYGDLSALTADLPGPVPEGSRPGPATPPDGPPPTV